MLTLNVFLAFSKDLEFTLVYMISLFRINDE